MKIESKIGTIKKPQSEVYTFLADFSNYSKVIPEGYTTNWKVSGDACSFTIKGLGDIQVKMFDKDPPENLKFTGEINAKNIEFTIWIQLSDITPSITKIKLAIDTELPPFLDLFAKKPLQEGIDTGVDQIEKLFENI